MARILVIEDHPANRMLAELILRHAGHDVRLAENAEQGLALARAEPFDLIVMDVQMPGLDGLMATRRLRADPDTAAIPVLAVSALAMTGDAERILAAGCDAYLAKPYAHAELTAAVAQLLAPRT